MEEKTIEIIHKLNDRCLNLNLGLTHLKKYLKKRKLFKFINSLISLIFNHRYIGWVQCPLCISRKFKSSIERT